MAKLSILSCLLVLLLWRTSLCEEGEVDFLREIKPIFAKRCFRCHSSLKQESSLRLDSVSAILDGGDSGPAVVPGDGQGSLLIERIVADEGERMPPEGEPLTDAQVALLRSWIDQGQQVLAAQTSRSRTTHWAFQPPTRSTPPATIDAQWPGNAVDAFIAAGHQQQGLAPAPPAAKHILLRRVYLDLIGLPPTPRQLEDFLADESPGAYEKVVDQLLESPLYGQRWGRHWMDVWRYSDWSGFKQQVRNSQPHIWRWRDWIIDSLNDDKPYDRMVLEMLAADEIAPTDADALRATGFLVRNWYKFNRNVWLDNTIDHTCKAFLGVTMGCARCHDHMYDPITQPEYYRFRAFFEPHDVRTDRVAEQANTAKAGLVRIYDAEPDTPTYLFVRGDDRKLDKDTVMTPALPELFGGELEIQPVSLPTAAFYPGLQPFVQQQDLNLAKSARNKARAALKAAAAALKKAHVANGPEAENSDEAATVVAKAQQALAQAKKDLAAAEAKLTSVKARIAADNARYASPPSNDTQQLIAAAVAAQQQTALLAAEADVPRSEQALASAQQAQKQKPNDQKAKQAVVTARKNVADALKKLQTATAALKKPPLDYAPLGPKYKPTSTGRRTALAQWIVSSDNPLTARVAVNHIWMRHFGAPLVDNVFDFGHNAKPPRHRRLLDYLAVELMEGGWRMKPLHRLMVTSRAYRMQSWGGQAYAGNVRIDPDNLWLWRMNSRRMEAEIVRDSVLHVAGNLDTSLGGPELDHNQGLTTHRRSVYYRHAYEKQMQFLMTFDVANVEECYRRSESIVPQQALALANSSMALAQARDLAGQLSKAVGPVSDRSTTGPFIAAAYQRVLCRTPSPQERKLCSEFLARQAERLADKEHLTVFTSGADSQVKPSSDPQQRARENLVQVLMNHNDFVTIR